MDKATIKKRDQYIDVLKGFAIISVVLYHCGLLTNGYLGVDIFLVISGYFLMKSCIKVFDSAPNRKVGGDGM